MKKLLLFVLMLLPMVASADVTGKCGANVYYSYNESTQKLTISGKGPMYDYDDMMDDYSYPWRGCSIKFLEIEDGVTSVGDFNFSNKGMISLSLPNSVTSIGQCAFYGCGSLNSIALPNSLTRIGNNAFTGCNNLTTIVSEIMNPYSIDNSVFSSVFSKAKLIVPKGTISKYKATDGWKSFANIVEATGNEEADITDNGIYYHLKSDGSLEVTGLASWTTVADIPSSIIVNGTKYRVTSIGAYAFKGRSDIMYLSIPYSIKSIGEYAFMDCGSNMTVNIADPESWCQMQLGNEHASPLSSAGKMLVHDIETTSFEVPSTVTSIGAFTFYQCSCLTSVNVPSTVTSIGSSAFEDCDYLTTLTLSKGLQSIGGSAFEGCKRLPLVTIPSSVKSIAINAFKNCSGLSSVISEIENPFIIDNSVFNGIPSNAQLIVPKGTMVAYQATEGWNRISSIVEFGDNGQVFEVDGIYYRILNIEGKNFVSVTIGNMEYSGDIVIPNQVTYNGTTYIVFCHDWGVFNSSSLTSISIGIADIGEYAFGGCSNLKTVIFTNAPRIGDDAFSGCNNLTSIIIPNGSFIRKRAFANCKGLTSLILGDNVGIETDAFGGCSNLKTIVSEIVDPLDIDNHVFDGIPSDAQLIVPKGTKEKYQYTKGWNKFSNIVEVGGIGYVFEADGIYYMIGENNTVSVSHGNTKYFGDIVIPNQVKYSGTTYSVTRIEDHAFYECCDLTSIKIPNSVTRIGSAAFHGCNLTSVVIGKNVTEMGSEAFKNNSNLTSVVCNSNSVAIGSSFFEECYNLKYICVTSDEYPGSFLGTMKCQCIMPQSVFDGGVPEDITNYVTYSAAPKFITVKSTTATTATLELTPIDLTGESTGGTPYEVTIFGLKPGSFFKGFWKDGSSDQGLASIPTVTTKNLVMNVQPAKPTSKIKARLLATVNELDDDTHFGFEWLRYDAPDNMTPNKVSAPLYDGQIVGTLNNLNPDVYYKYRPYYKSEDGSLFYGEWESFITGDADVFFEPETHTKDVVEVSSVSAELAGVWIEGTEDIDEKGFEYWAVPGGNTRAAGRDVKKVIVSGKKTSVVVEDLAVGTIYGYRSYMKTVSGITYGEEKTFMTINVGDVNGDGNVDFTDVNLVVSHIMGNTPIGFNMDAADVNNDGKVNAADIVLINGMIKK